MDSSRLVRILALLVAASLPGIASADGAARVVATGTAYAADLHELVLLPSARAVALPAGKFTFERTRKFGPEFLKAKPPADYSWAWTMLYSGDCATDTAKSIASEATDPQRVGKAKRWQENGADFDPRWYPTRESWHWGDKRHTRFCLDGVNSAVIVTVSSPTGDFDVATINAVLKGFADAVGPGTAPLSEDIMGYVRGTSNAPSFTPVYDLYPASLVPVAKACNDGGRSNCEALRAFASLQQSCDAVVPGGDFGPVRAAPPESIPGCIATARFSAKHKDFRVAALYMQRACDAGSEAACADALKLRKKAGL